LLGKKEFVIRLPSVIAGLAYLAAAGMICRKLLGDGWQFFCGAVLLSANPLVADYLSISRGYGAALAFFAWGFYALLGSRTVRAGLLFGLSVASNLTFLFPVAAMGTVYGDGLFVGEHGSWNRSVVVGYKVVFVPFRDGRPSGDPVDFVTGFLGKDGKAHGRPVGVTVDPRGGTESRLQDP